MAKLGPGIEFCEQIAISWALFYGACEIKKINSTHDRMVESQTNNSSMQEPSNIQSICPAIMSTSGHTVIVVTAWLRGWEPYAEENHRFLFLTPHQTIKLYSHAYTYLLGPENKNDFACFILLLYYYLPEFYVPNCKKLLLLQLADLVEGTTRSLALLFLYHRNFGKWHSLFEAIFRKTDIVCEGILNRNLISGKSKESLTLKNWERPLS